MDVEKKKLGIEETVDVFDFADKALDTLGGHLSDDGKLDTLEWMQTGVAIAPAGLEAFVGIGEVRDEMKDLDPDEMKEVAARGVMVVQKLLTLLAPKA